MARRALALRFVLRPDIGGEDRELDVAPGRVPRGWYPQSRESWREVRAGDAVHHRRSVWYTVARVLLTESEPRLPCLIEIVSGAEWEATGKDLEPPRHGLPVRYFGGCFDL